MILLKDLKSLKFSNFKQIKLHNLSLLQKNQLVNPILYKLSCINQFTKQQLDELIQKNQYNYLDSNSLLDQFNDNVEKINNTELGIQFSKYYINQFQSRMEADKALIVCDHTIDIYHNKLEKDSPIPLMYLKGQKIMLSYEQGKLSEVNKLSNELLALFLISKEILDTQTKIKQIKYLADIMARVNRIDLAQKYLFGSIDLIQNSNQILELSQKDQFDIYYLHFGCNYIEKNFEEAVKCGLLAFQLIKDNIYAKPQLILIGLYFCFKYLNQYYQCQQIYSQLLLYPQIEDVNLNEIDRIQFIPFRKSQPPNQNESTSQYQEYINNMFKSKVYSSDHIWNESIDEGQQFVFQKKYQEGIDYYNKILKKLDEQKDQEKIINIQDRIAYFYSELQNMDKAIELTLNSHKKLLKLRNNILYKDGMTYQNLLYLKLFYFYNRDFIKSIEWGKKWHIYCLKYNLFEIQDEIIIDNMFFHVTALLQNSQKQEALDYCLFIEDYLNKFENKKMLKTLNLILLNLFADINDIPKALERAISVSDYYKNNQKDISQEAQFKYFQVVLTCTKFSLELQDEEDIIKYGKEYIDLRKKYELQDENKELRALVKFYLSKNLILQKKFQEAEDMVKLALPLIEQFPYMVDIKFQLKLFQFQLLEMNKQINETEEVFKEVQTIFNKNFKDSDSQLQKQFFILQMESIIYFNKSEYSKCIESIEKYLMIELKLQNKQMNLFSQKQKEMLKSLLNKQDYKKQAEDIVIHYNIQMNV